MHSCKKNHEQTFPHNVKYKDPERIIFIHFSHN